MSDEPCCPAPRLQSWRVQVGDMPHVNALCLSCRTHWWGPEGQEKRYSRAEWEALMENGPGSLEPGPRCF